MDSQQHKAPSQRDQSKGSGSRYALILGSAGGLIVIVALLCAFMIPFDVTVNGEKVTLKFGATAMDAVESTSATFTPGNMIAVDGSLIEVGKGTPVTVTVNGEPVNPATFRVSPNDVLVAEDGSDEMEPSHWEERPVVGPASVEGTGAVHIVTENGKPGLQDVLVGEVSGLTVGTVKEEPVSTSVVRRNIDTGGDKVIALTFDDGPQTHFTTQILDLLAEHGAKATFFTVGTRITGDNVGVVKRAVEEGHMVTTHTFSHAAGSGKGVNLGYMTPDEQVAEVVNGLQAVKDATGTDPSKYIRVPGGNFGEDVIANIGPYIKGEIGWNIDTKDWERPGVESIKEQLLNATAGDIVLMHDGGGDRSQTVEALSQALPTLKSRGYRFITVEEMLEYL